MRIHFGYELEFDCPQPTPMILMLHVHPSRIHELVRPDDVRLDPAIPPRIYHDGFGNTCTRIRVSAATSPISPSRADIPDAAQVGYAAWMTMHTLFPTHLYTATLQRTGTAAFNRQLLKEARQLRHDDAAGRRWSAINYPGGYTSYGSVHRLQQFSPTFELLQRRLQRHVAAFAESVEWDLVGRELGMTDCWVNIMPRRVAHSLHLHPLSTLSGTYFVQVPAGSPGLKFEDPRLDRFMAAPPRRAQSRPENKPWVTIPAAAGKLVLFESWLRHEVAANPVATERVSVSFNYNWF